MLNLEILSPEKVIFTGDVSGVKMPGIGGSFEVLTDHAPLISALSKGIVRVNSSAGKEEFQIQSGFVEVLNNKVVILVEGTAE